MTAESRRAWWRDYWDAFTRSGAYDPATMAYRARMERLAAQWEQRAAEQRAVAQGSPRELHDVLVTAAMTLEGVAHELRQDAGVALPSAGADP